MSDWKPIETAPKDGSVILVHGGIAYWRERLNHWEGPAGWWTLTAYDWPGKPIQWEVKHWMPMPQPPTDEPMLTTDDVSPDKRGSICVECGAFVRDSEVRHCERVHGR